MTNENSASDTDPLAIADLLTEVVRALVDVPENVSVDEKGEETTTSLLMISVHPDDVGKVLGRDGKTIKALREVFSKIARVEGRQCVIEIVDPRKSERKPKGK
jgi:predicted RNA-binding protein YlqC (UPF0109 family)